MRLVGNTLFKYFLNKSNYDEELVRRAIEMLNENDQEFLKSICGPNYDEVIIVSNENHAKFSNIVQKINIRVIKICKSEALKREITTKKDHILNRVDPFVEQKLYSKHISEYEENSFYKGAYFENLLNDLSVSERKIISLLVTPSCGYQLSEDQVANLLGISEDELNLVIDNIVDKVADTFKQKLNKKVKTKSRHF